MQIASEHGVGSVRISSHSLLFPALEHSLRNFNPSPHVLLHGDQLFVSETVSGDCMSVDVLVGVVDVRSPTVVVLP